MPKRIAVNTIFVIRDGRRLKILPGTEIDLTTDELETLKKMSPDSIRNPINESSSDAGRESARTAKSGGKSSSDATGDI